MRNHLYTIVLQRGGEIEGQVNSSTDFLRLVESWSSAVPTEVCRDSHEVAFRTQDGIFTDWVYSQGWQPCLVDCRVLYDDGRRVDGRALPHVQRALQRAVGEDVRRRILGEVARLRLMAHAREYARQYGDDHMFQVTKEALVEEVHAT